MPDSGCAFLTVASTLIWTARSPRVRLPLASISAVFPTAHALLHAYDTGVGSLPSDHGYLDFAGIYPLAILVGVAVFRLQRSRRVGRSAPSSGMVEPGGEGEPIGK